MALVKAKNNLSIMQRLTLPLKCYEDAILYKNHLEVQKLRQSCRKITFYLVKKKIRYTTLIKLMTKKQSKLVSL